MRRRPSSPPAFDVWPAFTDVLGGLVVVLIFMITVFVISEVLIGREMTGKDSAIIQLQRIIELLDLQNEEASDELTDLEQQLANTQATAADSEAAMEAEIAQLSRRTENLTQELERLNRALLGTEEELAAASEQIALRESVIDEQAGRINEMDTLIKERLLNRVEELEQYASDFFGRLRDVFADNPNIKIEGDRFVFQSEVLFPSGEAILSPEGKGDLEKFVEVYQQVANQLPEDVPVIIQVQGHTDRIPISNSARFASNWELSSARALDVVNYLIDQGVPPERLAAVGMGEYHPISEGRTAEDLRRNRRIELKITSR